jgi:hypothetical protein
VLGCAGSAEDIFFEIGDTLRDFLIAAGHGLRVETTVDAVHFALDARDARVQLFEIVFGGELRLVRRRSWCR